MFTSLAVQETIVDTNFTSPKQENVLESLKQKHNILILTHQCFFISKSNDFLVWSDYRGKNSAYPQHNILSIFFTNYHLQKRT